MAVATGILCGSAIGQDQLHETNYGSVLLSRPNPALAGIEKLAVVIVPTDDEPNRDGLVWKELETKIIEKLNKATVKIIAVIAGNILDVVELRVDIDMLKLADSQQYVFRIQTSLSRAVCLAEEQKLFFKANVWETEPVMQAASAQNMPDKVTNVVLEQIESFIHAYLAANPEGAEPAEGTKVSSQPQEKNRPAAKVVAAKSQYVASKNSKVFHEPNCSSAQRIKPKNRVFYNSRNKAINAGRRPCKLCKP